jgi:hypothetical protein
MRHKRIDIGAARRAFEAMERQIGPKPQRQISEQEYLLLQEQERLKALLKSLRPLATMADIDDATTKLM